ncbi:flagellar motor protein MotB [Jannaschia seohaensis]|uniref:Chemotaxis protein MotB n=1 Tax=Jannaschia seohaensis TaxID=475081 RepID=A0A2Y9BW75_9RHOB|nr:flagellar motor protein MotB [Jannaschia seohaensis]PWJ22334.1 chemotaxis protein MotB [Jannaschia seohaensis]SSA38612.1 chemotaxis protein MotB [Jannaschia seohaensis]
MADDNQRPIIIKRPRVTGGRAHHHGGAWKVAYADFVTAMMAFFMLMWLLNATTEMQRRGLADYFTPTVALSRVSGGGDGALGGNTISADTTQVLTGRGGITPSETHGSSEEEGRMEAIAAAVLGQGGESLLDREELRHVSVRLTDEGLVVELFDLPDSPLFDGSTPTAVLMGLLEDIAPLLRAEPNGLALSAFTAAEPIVTRDKRAWDRSAERGLALRLALIDLALDEARVVRVTGHADRRPAVPNPLAERNNRVEIVLLRSSAVR